MEQPTANSDTNNSANGKAQEQLWTALLTELQNDSVHPADHQTLAAALINPELSDTRLATLENRVSELSTYTDSLKHFLDRWGTEDDLIDQLNTDMARANDTVTAAIEDERADLTGAIEQLRSKLSRLDEALETAEHHLESTIADIESLTAEIDAVEADLERMRADVPDVAALDDRTDAVAQELADVEAAHRELSAFRDQLIQAVDSPRSAADEPTAE